MRFFFPNECAICEKRITPFELLCESCEKEVFRMGPSLEIEKKRGYIVHHYGPYDGKLRDLILSYKSGRWRLSTILVKLYLKLFEYYPPPSILMYVPSTLGSIEKRGFDHMEILARKLAKISGMVLSRSLKVVSEERQMGKSGIERKRDLSRYVAEFPGGREVALIDDVITTGSTIREASKALLDSGVEMVKVYVLAKSKRR